MRKIIFAVLFSALYANIVLASHIPTPPWPSWAEVSRKVYYTDCGNFEAMNVKVGDKELWSYYRHGNKKTSLLITRVLYDQNDNDTVDYWLDSDMDGHIDYHEQNTKPALLFVERYGRDLCNMIKK